MPVKESRKSYGSVIYSYWKDSLLTKVWKGYKLPVNQVCGRCISRRCTKGIILFPSKMEYTIRRSWTSDRKSPCKTFLSTIPTPHPVLRDDKCRENQSMGLNCFPFDATSLPTNFFFCSQEALIIVRHSLKRSICSMAHLT